MVPYHVQLVGKDKREAEASKIIHDKHIKKQAQELLEQYLAYTKVVSIFYNCVDEVRGFLFLRF
jgi:hypothetical protein